MLLRVTCVQGRSPSAGRDWRARRAAVEDHGHSAARFFDREGSQQSSHANELEVVRDGACAIAAAAVYAEGGYLVRKRPRHGSGADYLMMRVGDGADNFVRLEVSGTARGDAVELWARLAQKRVQLREGRDPAPGITVVVAFKDAIVRREDA